MADVAKLWTMWLDTLVDTGYSYLWLPLAGLALMAVVVGTLYWIFGGQLNV